MATNKQLHDWAISIVTQNQALVSKLLGIPVGEMPEIKLGDLAGNQTGSTANGVITLDKAWLAANYKTNDGKGGIVHELAHVFMDGAAYNTDEQKAEQEGIAQAVREALGYGPGTATGDGYQSGKFYSWLAENNPKQFHALTRAMTNGDLHPFDTVYGSSVNNLKNSYQQGDTSVLATSSPSNTTNASDPDYSYHGGRVPGADASDATPAGKGDKYHVNDWTSNDPNHPPTAPPVGGGNWVWNKQYNTWLPDTSKLNDVQKYNRQNAFATYSNILTSAGLDPNDPQLALLMQHAVKGHWNSDRFYNNLYDTKEFQNQFPGFFDANGVPKMSIAQYQKTEDSYNAAADRYGIDLGNKKMAYLFNNDVSPSEFGTRASALNSLQNNDALYKQFGKALVESGVVDKVPSQDELFKFVLGQGNQDWYDEWNLARTRYAATQAGLQITKKNSGYTSISPGMAGKIAGQNLSDAQLQKNYQALAQQLLTTLPASKIAGYGISKKQIQEAVFGGPKQAVLMQKIQHIMATDQAFSENRANQQTYADAQGNYGVLGGAKERPQG